MKPNKILIFIRANFIVFALIFALSTCFSPYGGEDEGILTLDFTGGADLGRSALPTWPPANITDYDQLSYIITLSGSGGSRTETAFGQGPFIFSLSSGRWTINVKVFCDNGNEFYAEGSVTANITRGNNVVSLLLRRAGDYTVDVAITSPATSLYTHKRGSNLTIDADLFGFPPATAEGVTWSLEGGNLSSLSIFNNPTAPYRTILTTTGETADSLTVRVTSNADKYRSASIRINLADITDPVLSGWSTTLRQYGIGGTVTVMPLTISVTNESIITSQGGAISYQWFSNTSNSNSGGTPIPSATSNSYTPPNSSTADSKWYYVEVTNTDSGTGATSVSKTSAVQVIIHDNVTVSFNARGGIPAPGSQNIPWGTAPTLTSPNRSQALAAGLYNDTRSDAQLSTVPFTPSTAFSNWHLTSEYGTVFSGNVTSNITLYARYGDDPIDLSGFSGTPVLRALNYVRSNTTPTGNYVLLVGANDSLATQTTSTGLYLNQNRRLVIEGLGGTDRTIQLTGTGPLFAVSGSFHLVLGNNITLQGVTNNNNALVRVFNGGTLRMLSGSKITGNTNTANNGGSNRNVGGGVAVSNQAIWNEGEVAGGSAGKFFMEGGEIIGNSITQTNMYSSAVYVRGGNTDPSFVMTGGTITGNSSSVRMSGAVYGYSVLKLLGGTINGNTNGDATTSLGADVFLHGPAASTDSGLNRRSILGGNVVIGRLSLFKPPSPLTNNYHYIELDSIGATAAIGLDFYGADSNFTGTPEIILTTTDLTLSWFTLGFYGTTSSTSILGTIGLTGATRGRYLP